jgi:pyridinium-3,5-bisthiocarboxylic acid mononucleotide nickel chelatase
VVTTGRGTTRIAMVDPVSGIAGDMCLGALLDAGLPDAFVQGLPQRLGLADIGVRIARVKKRGIAAVKVDFDIPPQPHGRHVPAILTMIAACEAPEIVKMRAAAAFTALGNAEAAVHGSTLEKVHLHEVGAVDAILDIVGTIWGLHELGVTAVFTTPIHVGDGTIDFSHGVTPVPAPAVVKLLEGFPLRSGPTGSGELTTPTGAVLLRTLATAGVPPEYTPVAQGYGAGTKELPDRANVLRLMIADVPEAEPAVHGTRDTLAMLACDVDDMTPELLAAAADAARQAGALDVVVLPTVMKKGRPGFRLELLCRPSDAERFIALLLEHTTTLGVRRTTCERVALPREMIEVQSFGHTVRVKVARLPDGSERPKPEADDVLRVAEATGRSALAVSTDALHAAQHALKDRRKRETR